MRGWGYIREGLNIERCSRFTKSKTRKISIEMERSNWF
jgi:hypothetical protein